MERARPERWEAVEGPIREEPSPRCQSSRCPSGLAPTNPGFVGKAPPSQPLACILPAKLVHNGFAVLRTGPPGPDGGCHPALGRFLLLLLL